MKEKLRFSLHRKSMTTLTSLSGSAAVVALLCAGAFAAQGTTTSTDGVADNIETVVVTGQRAAISAAIQIKEKADVIVDTVAAEDVGKLPDNSVTEVLQRLPGVNISRIETGSGSENYLGEGTGVTIRGLSSTVSMLNGRDSFSASSGRNLAWEDIPPELAQGIDVYKSLSATLPEGGFGGVINLRSRQPFDFEGFQGNISLTGNYADYAKKGHPGGGLMLSDRWHTDIGNVGLLVNITYSDLETKADGVQVLPYYPTVYNADYANTHGTTLPSLSDDGSSEVYVPGGFGITRANSDRVRLGLYLAAQWQPLDDLLLGVTVFRSRYTRNALTYSMFLGSGISTFLAPNSSNEFDDDGNLTYTNGLSGFMWGFSGAGLTNENTWGYEPIAYTMQTQYSHVVNITSDVSFTAEWMPTDDFSAKFALQYVDSSSDQQDYSAALYSFVTGYGMNLTAYGDSSLPSFDFPEDSVDLSNSANYAWQATMPHKAHNFGREWAGYLDTVYTLSDVNFFRKLSSGLKITTRSEADNETQWNWKELSPWYSSGTIFTLDTDESWATKVDLSDMYGGSLGLSSAIWFPSKKAARHTAELQSLYNDSDNYGDEALATFTKYTLSRQTENTLTGYAMLSFSDPGDMISVPFDGNIGVRIVAYRDSSAGYRFTPDLDSSDLDANGTVTVSSDMAHTLVQGKHSQVDVLPSLNLQFLPTPETHVRFAFSQAVSRPTFDQMNPRGYVSGTYSGTYVSYFSGSWGNPDLKPEKAEQVDLSVEYYFPSGGMVHIAGFWKQIHNFIAKRQADTPTTFDVTVDSGSIDDSAYCSSTGTGTGTCTVDATITEYFNEKSAAKIQGYEFGIQKYATFLPAPFDGLGIDFNYTYIDSQQPGAEAYDMKGQAMSGLPVTGLSKNTINISGMYDKGPLSLRVAYNWRSHFLVSTAAWQTAGTYNNVESINYGNDEQQGDTITFALPVYQYSIGTLDASMAYQLTEDVSLSMQASNLTRSVTRLYMDETEVGSGVQRLENRSWYVSDTRYSMQLRMKF